MATTAEIIFVGLCTFVNMRNVDTGPDIPPPSVVVMDLSPSHKSFIAYDAGAVTLTGTGFTARQLSTSSYYYVLFNPEGEELTFNDDHTKVPKVEASFDSIASFSDYSTIARPAWVETYIPKRVGVPAKKTVAAFAQFGAGTIKADRMTGRLYQFSLTGTDLEKDKARCYAREIHYDYPASGDGLLIEARSLDTHTKRTLLFTPKGTSTNVQIWIGTSTDPLGDILKKEPMKYQEGKHFREFYKAEQRPDSAATDPIPWPLPYDCNGDPAPLEPSAGATARVNPSKNRTPAKATADHAMLGEGDPELGYCGPEGKP